jgi:hypothetical protein
VIWCKWGFYTLGVWGKSHKENLKILGHHFQWVSIVNYSSRTNFTIQSLFNMTIIGWIEDFMINLYENHGRIHAIAWNHAQVYYNFIQMEKVGVIELTYVTWHL